MRIFYSSSYYAFVFFFRSSSFGILILVNAFSFYKDIFIRYIASHSMVYGLLLVVWILRFVFGMRKQGMNIGYILFIYKILIPLSTQKKINRECLALLQGHSALVCQLQLSPTILATGGSDGRVIIFSLETYTALHRIAAHDSSVISLQFDKNFLVTGGNDGRVKLYETQTGNFVRELNEPGECVWKVAFVKFTCAIMCKRGGKTVVEIWSLGKKRQRYIEEIQKGDGDLC